MPDYEGHAKRLREARERLAEFRRVTAGRIDPYHPDQDIRSQVSPQKITQEVHAAVDSIIETGIGLEVVALMMHIERTLQDAANDCDDRAKHPIHADDHAAQGRTTTDNYA